MSLPCLREMEALVSASTSPIPAKKSGCHCSISFELSPNSLAQIFVAHLRHPLQRSNYVSFIPMRPHYLSFAAQALDRRVARHFLVIVYTSAQNDALGACITERIFANLSARRHRKRARNSNTDGAPGIKRIQPALNRL
jgi:hypothetical protein